MPVNQVFCEFGALEFRELYVLFKTTVQRHAYLPWPCEHLRVLDGRFIPEGGSAHRRVTLDDVELIAVEVSGPIEPRPVVLPEDIDDKRVSVPAAVRLPHPRVGGTFSHAFHEHLPTGAGIFVRDENHVRIL